MRDMARKLRVIHRRVKRHDEGGGMVRKRILASINR
jgi:hypothetical protein